MRAGLSAVAAAAMVLGFQGVPDSALEELDRAARDIVDRCSSSVVRIEAVRNLSLRVLADDEKERQSTLDRLRRTPPRETVSASGFLMDESGLVLTTSAVSGGALSVRVIFPGGQDREGELLGEDALAGVALLRVTPVEGAKALRFSVREARPGTLTLFLVPQEEDSAALHLGFVTSARRAFGLYDAWLVSSVPLEAGNAGAPLLDAVGEVLGMAVAPRISVTVRVTPAAAGTNLQSLVEQSRAVEREPGFSTFVPAGELRRIAADLLAIGRVRRGLLGVKMNRGEAVVREVVEDFPAAKGGIAAGDRILALDGVPLCTAEQVTGFIQRRAPGTTVRVRLRAPGGPEREAIVVLGELPKPEVRRALFNGIGVNERETYDLSAAKFQAIAVPDGRFVVVESVNEGSAADRAGIRPGDWVVEIGGKAVLSQKDFDSAATGPAALEDSVEVLVYRAGEAERRRVVLK